MAVSPTWPEASSRVGEIETAEVRITVLFSLEIRGSEVISAISPPQSCCIKLAELESEMQLSDVILEADVLCALEPEELGLRMLPVLAVTPPRSRQVVRTALN